jgi:hypothetical protein
MAAPNLAQSTLDLIHDMLVSEELTTSQMAEAAGAVNEQSSDFALAFNCLVPSRRPKSEADGHGKSPQ